MFLPQLDSQLFKECCQLRPGGWKVRNNSQPMVPDPLVRRTGVGEGVENWFPTLAAMSVVRVEKIARRSFQSLFYRLCEIECFQNDEVKAVHGDGITLMGRITGQPASILSEVCGQTCSHTRFRQPFDLLHPGH